MTTLYIREGTNEAIALQLFANNAPIDLSSAYKVSMTLVPGNGTGTAVTIDTTGAKLAISSATYGRIAWSPTAGDVTKANSPYKGFIWVYTSSTIKYAVPADEEFIVEVTDDFS